MVYVWREINTDMFSCVEGSETKLMLGKVSVQLEELRSKVDFLYAVKKYLQVLTPNTIDFGIFPFLFSTV